MESSTAPKDEQFVDVQSVVESVSAEDSSGAPLYQIESLCMSCNENGTTTFLLTVIPNFRQILLSAFECPHCNERNNYVQFGGEIQPKGCTYMLNVPAGDQKSSLVVSLEFRPNHSVEAELFLTDRMMFGRQVVKSETATIKIPELDFEIPPETQCGSLSMVEGILMRAVDELQALQEERKKVDPQSAEAIDQFLVKLKACATGNLSFTLVLDDPAGNSFIANPFAPAPDPSLTIKFYGRTPEQLASLGFLTDTSSTVEHGDEVVVRESNNSSIEEQREPHGSVGARAGRQAIVQGNSAKIADALFKYSAPREVMTLPGTCGACTVRCDCRVFVTNIPYFQEITIMASSCDSCGYRDSEVKACGPIPLKGKKIVVRVENIKDLSRDVIKSNTACVEIPEIDLELASGTMGGLVTTIEGLITQINDNLEKIHGFTFGDSLDDNRKSKWIKFRESLNKLLNLEEPWTLIIDDALAHSFVAPAFDNIEDDHQLTFEEYERSFEQNDELGLIGMDTSSADAAYDLDGAEEQMAHDFPLECDHTSTNEPDPS